MKNELDAIGQTVMVMGDAVVAVLGEQGSAREMAALQQAINAVQDARQALASMPLGSRLEEDAAHPQSRSCCTQMLWWTDKAMYRHAGRCLPRECKCHLHS